MYRTTRTFGGIASRPSTMLGIGLSCWGSGLGEKGLKPGFTVQGIRSGVCGLGFVGIRV